MGKSLVIVESPAKARTINRYLGDDYIVKSSVGHVRDLPVSRGARGASGRGENGKKKLAATARKMTPEQRSLRAHEQMIARLGVNPEKGWEARYETLPDKQKVVEELRELAKKTDGVYLATDLDREGEAIAWHLSELIGDKAGFFRRVVFNEITRNAIQKLLPRRAS